MNFIQNIAERIAGKRGWVLTLIGLAVSGMSLAMWWSEKIDTTEMAIGITIGSGLIIGKLPEKK